MEAAYLVYSSYIAALGEKLRRARQGMFPCQALRSFFLPFQSTGIPDSHSMDFHLSTEHDFGGEHAILIRERTCTTVFFCNMVD